jgi:hypothetical protein
MKKILLFVSCLLLFFPAMAQKGLKLGVFAGPQLGYHLNADDQTLSENIYSPSNLWGLNAGVSLGYNFIDMFGIKVQAVYSQQGNAYTRVIDEVETRFVDRLDYLKIPLLIGFNTSTDRRKVAFAFHVGPELVMLSRIAEYNDNPSFGLLEDRQDSKLLLENGERLLQRPAESLYIDQLYGIVGETGIDIQLPPDNVVFNLRIRHDMLFGDVENKDATATTYKDGESTTFSYWRYAFGKSGSRTSPTVAMSTSLGFGLTVTLGGN